VDEGRVQRRLDAAARPCLGRGLDEIAENGVVADLQRHAAVGRQLGLQGQDHPAAVVAQRAGLVELLADASRHEAAVAGLGRQVGTQPGGPAPPGSRQALVQRGCEGAKGMGQLGRRRGQGSRSSRSGGQLLADLQGVTDAPRSRGPPRPRARRDRPRAMSPEPFSTSRSAGAESGVRRTTRWRPGGNRWRRVQQRPRQARAAASGRRPRSPCGRSPPAGAVAAAVLGAVDLQAAARGRVDGHDVGFSPARRGARRRAACRPGWSPGGRRSGPGRRDSAGDMPPKPSRCRRRRAASAASPTPGSARADGIGWTKPPQIFSAWDRPRRRTDGRGPGSRRGPGRPGSRATAVLGHRKHLHLAGGELHRGHGRLPRPHGDGGQAVGAPGVQQAVLGQGARRHHPDHVAADHRFGAALLGLGRVFHLLADGDLEAQRGSAWRDRPRPRAAARPPSGSAGRRAAAGGLGDAQRRGGLVGVVEEQLVEIAHAEEHQGVRLARLGISKNCCITGVAPVAS
jgi:hypothetical protein